MTQVPETLNKIENADILVARKVAPVEEHPLGHLAGKLGGLGDQPPMVGLCAVTAAVGIWRNDRRLVASAVRMLAALTLATGLKTLVKRRINRSRPQLLIEEGHYEREVGDTDDHALKSFPSGHTAGMMAIAAAASRSYPERHGLAFLPAAVFSALQVPRRAHFVSDVVAGAAIGLLAGELVALAWRPARR